jgi:hypothetical protein
VCLEGNNQKQADFLAQTLVDPARTKNKGVGMSRPFIPV